MGLVIVVITAAVLAWSANYYRGEIKKCQKYPFFQLRDEVILALLKANDPAHLMPTYDVVNRSIERLHEVKYPWWSYYSFAVDMMTDVISELIDHGPDSGPTTRALNSAHEQFKALPEFEQRLIWLTVSVAQRNSLMLRLAISRPGRSIVIASAARKVMLRRIFGHRLGRIPRPAGIDAIKRYSYLAKAVAGG